MSFDDAMVVEKLRRLLESLQIEILSTIELLNDLHESADFTLQQLSAQQPALLKEVADVQATAIDAEIAQLETELAQLSNEIAELSGVDEQMINCKL